MLIKQEIDPGNTFKMDTTNTIVTQFAKDVIKGFGKKPKSISSKYFYDAKGDQIFQQIMHMPEYYLTRAEHEIFDEQYNQICQAINAFDEPFNLIELGAGDGYKTKLLLKYLLEQHAEFTYYPVDISENILAELAISLRGMFPPLKFHPLNYEYFEALKQLNKLSDRKNVILFLGSNIGNFHFEEAEVFIKELADNSKRNDMLLIGVDLKKDPNIIQLAYDDPKGITAAFNLNLLNRMNHELGANFDLNRFEHLAFYEQESGEMLSYIVSLFDQKVYFDAMDMSFNFEKGERIHTEVSKKYSKEEIRLLAEGQGLELTKYFTDSNNYFTDVLLTIK